MVHENFDAGIDFVGNRLLFCQLWHASISIIELERQGEVLKLWAEAYLATAITLGISRVVPSISIVLAKFIF